MTTRCTGRNAKGNGPCQRSAPKGETTCARCGGRTKRKAAADALISECFVETNESFIGTKRASAYADLDAAGRCGHHVRAVRDHEAAWCAATSPDETSPYTAAWRVQRIEGHVLRAFVALLEWANEEAVDETAAAYREQRAEEMRARREASSDVPAVVAACREPMVIVGAGLDMRPLAEVATCVRPEDVAVLAGGETPVADRDVKPAKPAKARPVEAAMLPGLEGYAKRDASLGQWDTHPEVARAFVKWCGVEEVDRVLEPSAGIGNIARALVDAVDPRAKVTCCEIDPDRAQVLIERGLADHVECGDFLACAPTGSLGRFELAAMNPPYENDGETRHMLHALKFAPRVCAIVRLVALASASRAEAWRSVEVSRIAVLVPRPVFAGSSGMDEIAFVEIVERSPGLETKSRPLLEWLSWRAGT
jgi:predicted RNA methylase